MNEVGRFTTDACLDVWEKRMRYRIFGRRTGLKVSELALGGGMFGTAWGYGAERDEVQAMIARYLDAGGNLIDTADNYQLGESERLIGEFVAPRRDDVVVASKYSRGDSRVPSLGTVGDHRKAMVRSVERSLERLRTDRIDLYFVHMDDGVTPVDEIMRGLDDLVRAGKILYSGMSNFPAWRIASAALTADRNAWAPVAAVQVEYNLLQRTVEREILPMADAFGLATMGWSPLAGGLLTGKYRRGERGRATDLKASVLHQDGGPQAATLDAIESVSREIGVPCSQIAIAWTRAKGVLPVIGPRTLSQLEDNLASAELTLEEEALACLDRASQTPLGYPHELLNDPEQRAVMTGGRWDRIDFPSAVVV